MTDISEFLRDNAALFISVLALLLTISNAWATRRHNRLSVRPRLATFTTYKDDSDDPSKYLVQVTLRNSGLGPAIVKRYEVILDGEQSLVVKRGTYFDALQAVVKAQLIPPLCTFSHLGKDYVMSKDELVVVASVAIRRPLYPTIRTDLQRFHLRIEYECAYGDKFVYDTRDHRDEQEHAE